MLAAGCVFFYGSTCYHPSASTVSGDVRTQRITQGCSPQGVTTTHLTLGESQALGDTHREINYKLNYHKLNLSKLINLILKMSY